MIKYFHLGFRTISPVRSLYVSLEIPRSTLKRLTQSIHGLFTKSKQTIIQINEILWLLPDKHFNQNLSITTLFAHIFRNSSKEANSKENNSHWKVLINQLERSCLNAFLNHTAWENCSWPQKKRETIFRAENVYATLGNNYFWRCIYRGIEHSAPRLTLKFTFT